jgi:3-phenylpropionate/trans-cinnamate dioxygenase ferredoxin reductase component
MHTSQYLIVGGGLTADAACKGIREIDGAGTIVLVAEEAHPPYARPPLSKALWKGDDESTIWRRTGELDVDVQLDRRVVALDLQERIATDDRGERYGFERLLLATGGRPRRLRSAAARWPTSARSTTTGICARSPTGGRGSS